MTKYENYEGTPDEEIARYGAKLGGESFTVGETEHTVVQVDLFLKRSGNPGTITLYIYATDGSGLPTGSPIISATFNGNDLPTTADWKAISIAETVLSANTMYAVLIKAPSGDVSNYVAISRKAMGSPYAGGTWVYDEGDTVWGKNTDADANFRIWGDVVSPAGVHRFFQMF